MKKLSVTTVLLLALILGSTVAYAGFNWDGDPIFKVNRNITVKVLVSADKDLTEVVTVELQVPEGVDARVAATHGFDSSVSVGSGSSVAVIVAGYSSDRSVCLVTVRVPKYHFEMEGSCDGTPIGPIPVE